MEAAAVVDEHGQRVMPPDSLLHGLFLNKHDAAGAAAVALTEAAGGLAARLRGLASRDAAEIAAADAL